MLTATMTSKGQVTVPVELRRSLKLDAGVQIEFIPDAQGRYYLQPRTRRAKDLAGILPKPTRPVTLEEMEKGIAAGMAQGMRS
ncbi:MAG: type II toxin-antitoxin system PrlF family antitoxin [Propionibacteriaceae bacterium]|jgi:bifunctional DNA-binding transcriptional regulator/antitoxin component of YhaV-PrlF toxin-antitoxin module|nr:type II toxin-antitoxin system PrlF family antitoxin [Propionibacteriaceae bacterium]